MDWTSWQPTERANLCFIRKDGHLLLIRKKRGLGAGKINAPGGKLEPGENAHDAAIRETQEEIGVTPLNLRSHGFLHFQFTDGYALHCEVFVASDWIGEPVSTDEADPYWISEDKIPYAEMWSDDIHWLPLMLEGREFDGFFTFDGDTMLTNEVRIRELQ